MADLKYKDFLFNNSEQLTISYKGKDPFKIKDHAEKIMRKTLEIDAPKFFLIYLGWDTTCGAYKAEWRAKRPCDRWTKLWYVMRTWGNQNLTPDKEGWANIKVWGYIETSYAYSHNIQKSLWWSYNYTFYNKTRRAYFEDGRDYLFQMLEKVKRLYGIYQGPEISAPRGL